MNISTGIDILEIERFKNWRKYKKSSLNKVFSIKELEYCLSDSLKSAERFAVRFAAREATFKALTPYLTKKISFLSFCKLISLDSNKLYPEIIFSKKIYNIIKTKKLKNTISWSHSNNYACATAILYFV